MNKPALAVGIGLCLLNSAICAQSLDMPKRKPGLWEVKMESALMHDMVMTMEQCINEKTDAEMQKKSMQGDGQSHCKLSSSKKTANGWEFNTVCKQEQTTITGHSVISGDFQSAYRMDTTTRFDPPMQGMTEMKSSMNVRYLGACRPDMKPGDVTVNGMKISQGDASGQASKMSPEQMKQMMDALKKKPR